MTRTVDPNGKVHFDGANGCTLCGISRDVVTEDLIGVTHAQMPETSAPVTCPDCARLYCAIKNAPWHEVADAAMDHGIDACGDNVWCGVCGNAGCQMRGADRIVKCDSFIREGGAE